MNANDSKLNLLIVKVEIPLHADDAAIVPGSLYAGTYSLLEKFKDGLKSADLLALVKGFGPINHSIYLFLVTDHAAAARVIISCLHRLSFASHATVLRMDTEEQIMRCIHPEKGNIADASKLPEEIFAAIADTDTETKRLLAEFKKWIQV